MIAPVGAESIAEAVRMGSEIFHSLKAMLSKAGHNTNVGDEGGFAPGLKGTVEALDFIMEAIEAAGYKPGGDVMLALDAAATEFFRVGKYVLAGEGKSLSAGELAGYWQKLAADYPIYSIEDGMAEDDFQGWKLMTDLIGEKIQIVGDDIFVTNPKRLAQGIEDTHFFTREGRLVSSVRYSREAIERKRGAGLWRAASEDETRVIREKLQLPSAGSERRPNRG